MVLVLFMVLSEALWLQRNNMMLFPTQNFVRMVLKLVWACFIIWTTVLFLFLIGRLVHPTAFLRRFTNR